MRYNKHILLVILCLILFSKTSFSQHIKLFNKETKAPLSDVFIYNKTQRINTVSDSNGIANISDFNKRDTLIFTHPSFKTFILPYINIGNVIYLNPNPVALKPVEITAVRGREEALKIAAKIDKIDAKTVALNNPQTTADMLELSGSVYIQKSQSGGGSPVIRGFEANRVLLVVDGVRMNNAIYRSGHLQNVITIDNAILEQTDIIYGANSVIYGSDAIGGVAHFMTKNPVFAYDTNNNHHVNSYIRYATVNKEKTAHLDVNLGYKKIASLSSLTFSFFDDLQMGKTANANYPGFGIEKYYVDQINGKDSMIRKENFYLQQNTNYTQADFLQKISYQYSKELLLQLNLQYSTSSDVHRYDQLTKYKGSNLKWADWYYGPQNRLLTALSAQLSNKNKWFTTADLTLSYQKIDESRITRKFKQTAESTKEEQVNVYGINADFHKKVNNLSEWFYGIEILHNTVSSSAFNRNIETSIKSDAQTRYPDGGSSLSSAGVYISYNKQFTEKATYSFGGRYSYSLLQAQFTDTTFIQLPFSNISLNNGAVTGNAGLVYLPNENWKFHTSLSSAYRSPNIDDVGKVFAKNENVMVPNDQLQPEYAYNAELGITKSFFKHQLKINAIGFYTLLTNAIVRSPFQLNGLDSITYEGETLKIQANVNTNKAIVFGFSFNLQAQISKELSLKSTLNYTVGENKTEQLPLGHIPPLYGRTDLTLNADPLILKLYVKYQGWKKIKDYSPTGEDNENKATVDGTPPWTTFNMSVAMKMKKHFMLQIALENLLDTHYRPFASGVSAPGRNLIVTLRGNF